jgi:hypothetical protein
VKTWQANGKWPFTAESIPEAYKGIYYPKKGPSVSYWDELLSNGKERLRKEARDAYNLGMLNNDANEAFNLKQCQKWRTLANTFRPPPMEGVRGVWQARDEAKALADAGGRTSTDALSREMQTRLEESVLNETVYLEQPSAQAGGGGGGGGGGRGGVNATLRGCPRRLRPRPPARTLRTVAGGGVDATLRGCPRRLRPRPGVDASLR